jgi:hypothetical protein
MYPNYFIEKHLFEIAYKCNKIPTNGPVILVVRAPATMDFIPKGTISSLLSGTMLPMPPIIISALPKLAKSDSTTCIVSFTGTQLNLPSLRNGIGMAGGLFPAQADQKGLSLPFSKG